MIHLRSLFVAALMVMVSPTTFAKDLRGSNFEELNLPNKELANTLIHGKDLQNDILGFSDKNEQQRRELTTFGDRSIDYRAGTGSGGTFKFFAIYTEFGPGLGSTIGASGGGRGVLYDIDKINANTLTQDDVVGSFQVACTVVAQNADQFCTYEILIFTDGTASQSYRNAISSSDAGFGTSIVTGSLSFAENDGGFLLVEATEDDFDESVGGTMMITFLSVSEPFVFKAELSLS